MLLLGVVHDFKLICKSIDQIIDKAGYKSDYVREKLGYSRPGWYKKRKAANFSPEELEELIKLIHAEQMEHDAFFEILKRSKVSGLFFPVEAEELIREIR